MPRLFKRSRRYNVAGNCFLAKIMLLDSTTVEFNLLPEVTGADCLEKVAQVMEIQEIDYFGLQYLTKYDSIRWVDREKPLRKQLEKHALDGARNPELNFRVQYYVANVTKLRFEITRYLYFLQLKELILNGQLECFNDLASKLASYALQAEFGNFDDQKHTDQFLSDYIFLPTHIGPPSVIKSLTDKASKLHQRHRGMSPASAELMYIKLSQQLPEYGHTALQKLDINGSVIWIGACFIGIFVKHSNGQPNIYFKWPDIFRMRVRDKNFGIETPGETVYFKMPDNNTAQYVLKMMINQHKFYRAELEDTPGLSWLASGSKGEMKSRSLHDLRSKAVNTPEPKHSVMTSMFAKKARVMDEAPIQRPLHRAGQRGKSEEPFSPSTTNTTSSRDAVTDPVELLSITAESGHHTVRGSSSAKSDVSNLSTPPTNGARSKIQENGTAFTPKTAVVMNGTKRRSRDPVPKQSCYSKRPPSLVIPTEPVPPSFFAPDSEDFIDWVDPEVVDMCSQNSASSNASPLTKQKLKAKKLHNNSLTNTSLDQDDNTDSSQETFDLLGGSRRKKLSGSLEQINSKTPPRSLKIRTFSIAEQEEQEAASGTRDRRGEQLEKILHSGKLYTEYELLPKKKLNADTDSGQLPENIHKNRYRDILPYEDTRIKLKTKNNSSGNDYINASFVNFSVSQKQYRYIVAQGPLEHTCANFWQMVWEQNIHFLIMLTNEVEDCRSKCFRYFPPDDRVEGTADYVQFDQYRISRLFVEKSKSVISRGFQLQHIPSGQEREVTHLQYIDWPDYGIPENPQPFLDFLADVNSLRLRYDSTFPTLVHCSAGVGRSGVVVLMDMLIAKVDCGDPIDIPKCLKELRHQRMHLVQMIGQYKFVYSAIVQYIGRARLI